MTGQECMKDLKDKLTIDRVKELIRRATCINVGGTYYEVLQVDDCGVDLLEVDGDEVEATYDEFMEYLAADDYNVKFYEIVEIDV